MQTGDENKSFSIVEDGFYEFVKRDLTEEGTLEFFRATCEMIFEKPEGHFIFVAECDDDIIGMIDVREQGHVCLFFVKNIYQGKGIGRKLMELAQTQLNHENHREIDVDVNSSLFAVEAYEKLGFEKLEDVQMINGIKFVPMTKKSVR